MEKVQVKCPNCGENFEVNVNTTRGKCPHCKISLIFENVGVEHPQKAIGGQPERKKDVLEENVNISYIENAIDNLFERATPSPKKISDVAVIESIGPESNYLSVEKKVDKILKARE
ncbi:MAG: hypothetical protein U9O96_04795 [Candidatus Thermoplasmatota archaeon]|nr:hypothetical protein [Candidatus Thermoplasmatota archaeon]